MSRYRSLVALVCIGLVLVAAFTPAVAAHAVAIILDRVWDVFVTPQRSFVQRQAVRVDEQTRARLSVLVSRPPPSFA